MSGAGASAADAAIIAAAHGAAADAQRAAADVELLKIAPTTRGMRACAPTTRGMRA